MNRSISNHQTSGNKITDTSNGQTGPGKLKKRFGISSLFDRKTKTAVELPEDIKIFHKNEKTWMGGTEDGEIYVHIERIATEQKEIPTILAEGDLDLFLCSTGEAQQKGKGIKGVNVSGSIGGKEVTGYLAQINIFKKMGYLVLAACGNGSNPNQLQKLAMRLVGSISSNYGKGE